MTPQDSPQTASDAVASSALQRAAAAEPEGGLNASVSGGVQRFLNLAIDGIGPIHGAVAVGRVASDKRSPEAAVDSIVRSHTAMVGVGGFVTGLGGFLTLPLALPVNVAEFYFLAARMVAGVASVRGYDVNEPHVRAAIALTLVGAESDEVLRKAGLGRAGRLSSLATDRLPAAAAMVVNKGMGFRVVSKVLKTTLGRLGKGVPVVGGVIGAALDLYLIHRIATLAHQEFPAMESPDALDR